MKIFWKKTKKGRTLKFCFFEVWFIATIISMREKAYTTGVRNITGNNKRILFLDYDSQDLDFCIMPEIKYLQLNHNLGDAYLFESSKDSFHVVFFDELDFLEWLDILKKTSCDSVYKNVAYFGDNASNVLRIAEKGEKSKPTFFKMIPSPNGRRMDRGLYKFFQKIYKFDFYYDLMMFNDSNTVVKIDYLTLNNTRVKDGR